MAPFCSLWRESEEIFLRRPVLKEGEADREWLIQVITILITIILHLIPIINLTILVILVITLTLIRIITIIIINFTMGSAHNATRWKAAELILPSWKNTWPGDFEIYGMDGTGEDDDQAPLVPADTPRWGRLMMIIKAVMIYILHISAFFWSISAAFCEAEN